MSEQFLTKANAVRILLKKAERLATILNIEHSLYVSNLIAQKEAAVFKNDMTASVRDSEIAAIRKLSYSQANFQEVIYNLISANLLWPYKDAPLICRRALDLEKLKESSFLVVGTNARDPGSWLMEKLIDIVPTVLMQEYMTDHGALFYNTHETQCGEKIPYAALPFSFQVGEKEHVKLTFVALTRNPHVKLPEKAIGSSEVSAYLDQVLGCKK